MQVAARGYAKSRRKHGDHWFATPLSFWKIRAMAFPQPALRLGIVFVAILSVRAAVSAQNVLLAEDRGAMSVVVAASKDQPLVMRDGKPKQIHTKGYRLQEVPEYLPVFVTVSDIEARSTSEDMNGQAINTNFHFNAVLRTSYPLDDVFVVLSMDSEIGGKMIFMSEVGHLDPNADRPLGMFFPLKAQMGNAKYELHIFSGGGEVLQTQIPFWVRTSALNKMVAKRIDGVDKSPPKFFVGPAPIYPEALKHANVSGNALITIRIAANGEVLDPVLKSASDPEFGKSALTAIQDWRFLPRVKDGYAVESKVDVPITFAPPKHAGS